MSDVTGPLSYTIEKHCAETNARVGRVSTLHGSFDTPAFMPVGTAGTIKGVMPDQIRGTGSQIILNNAYHLMLRPGAELVHQMGGVHEFMRWDGPILTDSGGYQAFSMSDLTKISEDGVLFRSIVDGSKIKLTPEKSIEVQNQLGPDIIMAFDDCPPGTIPLGDDSEADHAEYRRRIEASHERTVRWLDRCIEAHRRPDEQALFGIVQGGTDLDLRAESASQICSTGLPGYAIGGVAVGERADLIETVVAFTAPLLPVEKPRYLMGVGYERDIVGAVRAGVDMFDCVLPTRNGRNGAAFTRSGRLHLRNACHRSDEGVLEVGCDCAACAGGFSRAYLRHLFMAREMLGPILISLHNIRHFQRLMLDIRAAIREDSWSSLYREWPVLEDGQSVARNPPDPNGQDL